MLGIKHRIGSVKRTVDAIIVLTCIITTTGLFGVLYGRPNSDLQKPENCSATTEEKEASATTAVSETLGMNRHVGCVVVVVQRLRGYAVQSNQVCDDSPFSLSRTRSADDPTVPHQPTTEQPPQQQNRPPPPPPLHTIKSTRSVTACSAAAKASYRPRPGANCSRRCYHPHSSNSSPSRPCRWLCCWPVSKYTFDQYRWSGLYVYTCQTFSESDGAILTPMFLCGLRRPTYGHCGNLNGFLVSLALLMGGSILYTIEQPPQDSLLDLVRLWTSEGRPVQSGSATIGREHARQHGLGVYQYEACNWSFARKEMLMRHVMHVKPRYTCRECGKSRSRSDDPNLTSGHT